MDNNIKPRNVIYLITWIYRFLFFLQKEMFAAKVDGGSGGGAIGAGGVGGGMGASDKERKLSNSSGTGIKSKWVKAFKGIKKTNEDDVSEPR